MMDPQAELAKLSDPRWQAFGLLSDLLRADFEARVVRSAVARDLARVYEPQREIHRHAVALCDGAIEMLEDLRRLLAVGH